jgi:hypothetical protein
VSAAASAGPLSSRPPGSPRAGVAVAAAPEASQVLGAGVALEPASARLAALIDPGFLAEAGWGPASRVLSLPAGHALLGWRACPTRGCPNQVYDRHRVCGRCRVAAGQPGDHEIEAVGAAPARRGEPCGVAACGRDRGNRRYCRAHDERLRDRRRLEPGLDERSWRRIEPALEGPGQVSLHGVPVPVIVQVLYGLQRRTRDGAITDAARLRQIAAELRRRQPVSLEQLDLAGRGEQHKVLRCFVRHVRRAFLDPETERVKDVWDLAAFGLRGRLSFSKISQGWLREAAKRWAAEDLPQRRGKDRAGPVRHYLVSLAALYYSGTLS